MRKINIVVAVLATLMISSAYANCPPAEKVEPVIPPGAKTGSFVGYDEDGREWSGSQTQGRSGSIAFDSIDARGTVISKDEHILLGSIECKYTISGNPDDPIVLTGFFQGPGEAGKAGFQLIMDSHLGTWSERGDVEGKMTAYQCGKSNQGSADCPFKVLEPLAPVPAKDAPVKK